MRTKFGLYLALSAVLSVVPVLAKGDGTAPAKTKGPEHAMGVVSAISDTALTLTRRTKTGEDSLALTLGADTRYAEIGVGAAADVVKDANVLVLRRAEGAAPGLAVYSGTAPQSEMMLKIAANALEMAIRMKEGKKKGGDGATKPAEGAKDKPAAPAGPKPLFGKVKSLDGSTLVVTTHGGEDVSVTLATDPVVVRAADKTRADIAQGRQAVALFNGETKAASLVVQMPERKEGNKPKPHGDQVK